MGELLVELLSEEIPARMQRRAVADFAGLLRDKLAAAGIPAESLDSYVTPRRLAVVARGIAKRQPDRREERRGPRLGAPQKAIDGFLRAAGLASLADCEIRDTGRGEFYFAVIDRPGRDAADVLPEILAAAIAELPWPKSMRFPAAPLRWVRPLNSLVCLFDGAVLALPLGEVPVGRATRGHRFLSPGEIRVEDARAYLDRLRAAHVILDREERKRIVAAGLDERAAEAGVAVVADPGLLDEVAGLVEYPVVLRGAIDPDFMALPPEVLATAMRAHQKYFSCRAPDGQPAPFFLFVANNLAPDGGQAIVAGNERVLRARLADARFFWDQDRRLRLEERVEALKSRVYHEKLGSMYDKAERMEELAELLAGYVPDADRSRSRHAARLAKADLSTGMVGEFPELQGVVGRYYAFNDGEDPRIADAIAEHYKPLGPNDTCPTRAESVVVALADKFDALVALFAVGESPTGAGDPFALRRAALGVIRLVLEHQIAFIKGNPLRLPLRRVFGEAFSLLNSSRHPTGQQRLGLKDPTEELLAFIVDRLKIHLRAHGFRHDLIAAVFEPVGGRKAEDDLTRLHDRVLALAGFLASADGGNLLIAYRRASNIVAIEERRDGCTYGGAPDRDLYCELEEEALACRLDQVNADLSTSLANEDFVGAMSVLATLRRSVDEFFDKVTVNTEDAKLRENRLRLLSRIRDTMNQIADFSQIEG